MNYWPIVTTVINKLPWGKIFRRKQRCLLIVEDRQEDGEFLKALVGVYGHDCVLVSTAEAGLSLIEQKPDRFPICFLDMRLPLMSGLELIPRVLAIAPQAHVVAVTGAVEDLYDLPPGIYIGVISKPISASSIRSVINKTRL